MNSMFRLEVDNLGKRFGRRVLFRRLSFGLEGGEALAVTGPNGSGKSTLLKILGGVLRPTAGSVTLLRQGQALSAEAHPLHVGFVSPYINVYEDLSARENLAFLANARRLSERQKKVEEALDLVALSARAKDLVRDFSSGMKQRMKFAAALLASPPLLLLDEPLTNLDADGRDLAKRIVEHQRTMNGIVIVATNAPEEVAAYERVLRIDQSAGSRLGQ